MTQLGPLGVALIVFSGTLLFGRRKSTARPGTTWAAIEARILRVPAAVWIGGLVIGVTLVATSNV